MNWFDKLKKVLYQTIFEPTPEQITSFNTAFWAGRVFSYGMAVVTTATPLVTMMGVCLIIVDSILTYHLNHEIITLRSVLN